MLDEIGKGREAVRKMGVGGFCRHSALRPTPVPSAMTYFQSGFYLDQTDPCKKDSVWFFFVGYLWHCWTAETVSTTVPLGSTLFKMTVHTHGVTPSHYRELTEYENKDRLGVMDAITQRIPLTTTKLHKYNFLCWDVVIHILFTRTVCR